MTESNPESILAKLMLKGKKSIITGAGGGIGSAIANTLAELGAEVALMDRDQDALGIVMREIQERFPVSVTIAPVNVCNSEQVKASVKRIFREFGRIDILVNCHGIGQWTPAEDMTENDWDQMMEVNLKGVFIVCQSVGRYMIEQHYGKIINIASMSGTIVNKPQRQSHYNTSKAAVIMLTKSLAAEWAKYNININSVSPGYTLTPLVKKLLEEKPEHADYWKSLIPIGRLATPKDIVGAVAFLASDASGYVTGHDLIVDGGYTIW
jgi:NAD(P)-dependent dehydrogenase (short-subunit alcohol dehydrogenase family)